MVRPTIAMAAALLLTQTATPVGAFAQTLDLSPFVGIGSRSGYLEVLPNPADPSTTQVADVGLHTVLGLAAEVGWTSLPIRLRVSASRSFGASLGLRQPMADCDQCSLALGDRVGSASVTTLAADMVLKPFPTRLSPYVFAGLSRRRTSYENDDPAVTSTFDVSDGATLWNYGLGLDIDLTSTASFWVESTWHRGPWKKRDQGGLAIYKPFDNRRLTGGLRIPVL